MESSGSHGSRLLTAGGILSILGGILELTAGGIVLGIVRQIMIGGPLPTVPHISWMPGLEIQLVFFPARFIFVGILILVLGAIGIAGGISALSSKSFGLSLAGAICILPTVLFGILAIIFVALSKREFGVEAKENGIASRSRLLTAGWILSIIGGGVEMIGAGVLVETLRYFWGVVWLPVAEPLLIFLGFLSIIGGILAVIRRDYKASLTGAICALPTVFIGILAVIFIALGKREFGAKAKGNGI